jgi:hypothetical protein
VIRFTLACGRGHEFEGWFRDNAAFERQAADQQVSCPVCADTTVRKAVMAPAVSRGAEAAQRAKAKLGAMMQAMRQVREHVETNFENVGPRFAEEARRIHQGEAEKRDIWGQATITEAKELRDEGVPVAPLPDPPKLDG